MSCRNHTSLRGAAEEVGRHQIIKDLQCQPTNFEVYHDKEWRFMERSLKK